MLPIAALVFGVKLSQLVYDAGWQLFIDNSISDFGNLPRMVFPIGDAPVSQSILEPVNLKIIVFAKCFLSTAEVLPRCIERAVSDIHLFLLESGCFVNCSNNTKFRKRAGYDLRLQCQIFFALRAIWAFHLRGGCLAFKYMSHNSIKSVPSNPCVRLPL